MVFVITWATGSAVLSATISRERQNMKPYGTRPRQVNCQLSRPGTLNEDLPEPGFLSQTGHCPGDGNA